MKKLKIDKRVYRERYMDALTEIQLYGVIAKLLANRKLVARILEINKESELKADKAFIWAVYKEMNLLASDDSLTYLQFESQAPLSSDILSIKNDIVFSQMNIVQKILAVILFKIFSKKRMRYYPKYT